jgi:hypothetical protein
LLRGATSMRYNGRRSGVCCRIGWPVSTSARLLPLAGPALAERLLQTARDPATTFAIGVQGAVAEFMRAPADRVVVKGDADRLLLRSTLGALRLDLEPWVRVFSFGPEDGTPDEIVLAIHRSRLTAATACTISELGPDRDAVCKQELGAILFDLGLDRPTIRFCVRTDDPALIADLRGCVGQPWPEVTAALIPLLLERHPQRVVISPLGRIEVSQPIGLRDEYQGRPSRRSWPRMRGAGPTRPAPGPQRRSGG